MAEPTLSGMLGTEVIDLCMAVRDREDAQTVVNAILNSDKFDNLAKQLYAARAEQNNDGDNTYTIVLPYTAQVEETSDGYQITL